MALLPTPCRAVTAKHDRGQVCVNDWMSNDAQKRNQQQTHDVKTVVGLSANLLISDYFANGAIWF